MHQGGRQVERSLQNQLGTLRTMRYVLRTDQLAKYLSNDDGHHLLRINSKGRSYRLHGLYPHCHPRQPHTSPTTCPSSPYQTRRTQSLSQTREVCLRSTGGRIPGTDNRESVTSR